MSDENNGRGEPFYPWGETYPEGYAPYVQRGELETSDSNPVYFYAHREPELKKRITRWMDFIDR